jgi:periplasmic protein TonB
MKGCLIAAALVAAPMLAHAADAPPTGPVDSTQVAWERVPDPRTAPQYYPDRAQRMQVSGTTKIQCQVMDDLTLSNCKVMEESPAGYAFGAKAIQLSHQYKAAAGTPIGVLVNMSTQWTPN